VSSLPTLKAEYFFAQTPIFVFRWQRRMKNIRASLLLGFRSLRSEREQRTIHASRDEASQRPFELRASGFSLSENSFSADEPENLHDALRAEKVLMEEVHAEALNPKKN
jgi:hypothetical protein